MSLIGKKR